MTSRCRCHSKKEFYVYLLIYLVLCCFYLFICFFVSLFLYLISLPFYLFVLLYVKRKTFDQRKTTAFIEDKPLKYSETSIQIWQHYIQWAVSIATASVHSFPRSQISPLYIQYRGIVTSVLVHSPNFQVELFSENDSDRNRRSGGRSLHDPWIFFCPL